MHNSPDLSNSSITYLLAFHTYSCIGCQIPKGDESLGLKSISLAPGACSTGSTTVLPSPVGNQPHHSVTGHKSTIPSPFRKGDGFTRLIPGFTCVGAGYTVLLTILAFPFRKSSRVEIGYGLRFPRGTIWNNKNVYTRLKQLVMAVHGELLRPPFERGRHIWRSNLA
jgi:hypothetical protein